MPRSKNQMHHHWRPDPAGDWDIDDPHKFLARDGGARRAVQDYMEKTGLRQPQAVADLLMAGYASLVSTHPDLTMGGPCATGGWSSAAHGTCRSCGAASV